MGLLEIRRQFMYLDFAQVNSGLEESVKNPGLPAGSWSSWQGGSGTIVPELVDLGIELNKGSSKPVVLSLALWKFIYCFVLS